MMNIDFPIVLGSRSPRRRELLAQLLPQGETQIEVLPPSSSDEAGFEELHDWEKIAMRLQAIARTKLDDVWKQLRDREQKELPTPVVITADTVIVAADSVDDAVQTVLGQPPQENWQDTVRDWFQRLLIGRTHQAATAFCVSDGQRTVERIVQSEVTFHDLSDEWIEWYLQTGEPIGKAGGYAIQGGGSVFVSEVKGSISNVVGLPQKEVLETLTDFASGRANSRG